VRHSISNWHANSIQNQGDNMNAATNRLPSFLATAFFLTLMALLGGCGSGSSEPAVPTTPAELALTPTDSTANVGQTLTYVITGGVAPYSITPSNSAIAKVLDPGVTTSGSQSTFTVKALSLGTATLVLTDAAGTTLSSILAVWPSGNDLFTSAPSTVTIAQGASATYSIGGGLAPYSAVSSNTAFASAGIRDGSTLVVGGVAEGEARIVVTDAMGAQVDITVTVARTGVAALATTAPPAISLGVGASGAQTYTISGGTPPYTATSSLPSVATVSNLGNGTTFTVTGVSVGTARVDVSDSTNTATVSIFVNVTAGNAGFTVTPASAEWTVSGACPAGVPPYSVYFINGGAPPYTVSSTNHLIGTVMTSVPIAAVVPASTAVTVGASGGFFVVAWPSSPCSASGTASLNIVDSTGSRPTVTPTFKMTWTP
jgi:hypothetical protein